MENQDDKMILSKNTPNTDFSIELIIVICVSAGILLVFAIVGLVFLCRRIIAAKSESKENESNQYRVLRCKNRYSSSDTSPSSVGDCDTFYEEICKPRLSISHVQPRSHSTSQYHRLSLPSILQADTSETSDEEEAAVHRFNNIHGRIWFSIKYEPQFSQLNVTIIKARYLRARGLSHEARDPFVRVYLLPDESNFHQTKCRRRTLSPRFNESFHFQVTPSEINSRTLKISVYDIDKRRIRHLLGHALVPLEKTDVTNDGVMWRNLDCTIKKSSQVGELYFSLCVDTFAHRIKVAILKGRDLRFKHFPITHETELFIRAEFYYASKLIKFKDTTRQKFNENPNIFQHFSFSGVGRHFDSYSIILIVMLSKGDKDVKCARVSVGSLLYAHGEELKHWQDMLANPKTPVERWHLLTLVT